MGADPTSISSVPVRPTKSVGLERMRSRDGRHWLLLTRTDPMRKVLITWIMGAPNFPSSRELTEPEQENGLSGSVRRALVIIYIEIRNDTGRGSGGGTGERRLRPRATSVRKESVPRVWYCTTSIKPYCS